MVAEHKLKKLKPNDAEDAAIDGDLVLSIEKLQEIQDEIEKINEKASDEVLEVEKKYNEIRQPVYNKRTGVIQAIPDFWLTAFLSHPALSELVTDEDHKIFKHLTSIEVVDSKDVKSGYSISFNFSPNPYFEDTKLTKTFTFLDEGTTNVTATSIKWKEGMGIPNGVNDEKKGDKRSHVEESFFTWFSETVQSDDDINDDVAEIIKEDLWPNPLTYFNNDADEEDFDEEEDDDDDDEEVIEVSDEDDDDDDDGEDNEE
ncbi:NAP1-related protein 2-like isoform X2 [Silene latifolia]|uniref:NAP1-related protein 2-like isoform X2 n=1 Tax=Silene latifolia TaxID=37657 RepID=UPI003D77BAFA